MHSCCGNEIVTNSALSEVVSNNIRQIVNLVYSENSLVHVSLAAFVISVAVIAVIRRIGAKYVVS